LSKELKLWLKVQPTIEYIQAFEGADDGVEFFGGTVNANFVAVVNAQDDSIDWTEGYSGTLTNAYVLQGNGVGDEAFECDGFNTDFTNASGSFSNPTVTNVTIKSERFLIARWYSRYFYKYFN